MDELNYFSLLILGAFSGGFVNGLAGFGTSLFALGFWLQILPPVQAVAISLVVSVATGLQGLWVVRSAITRNSGRLVRFLVPAILGIPLGVITLSAIDPRVIKLTIAGFLILYGAFFIVRRSLPSFDRVTPVWDALIGLVGGFLGGFAGLSGALPAMWFALRPWPRQETRAVLQPFNVIVISISAAILVGRGVYTTPVLMALAVAIPTAFVGSQIGIFAFKRISDSHFRWLLIVLMFTSGSLLLIRELL